jgi:hypothetical protein
MRKTAGDDRRIIEQLYQKRWGIRAFYAAGGLDSGQIIHCARPVQSGSLNSPARNQHPNGNHQPQTSVKYQVLGNACIVTACELDKKQKGAMEVVENIWRCVNWDYHPFCHVKIVAIKNNGPSCNLLPVFPK